MIGTVGTHGRALRRIGFLCAAAGCVAGGFAATVSTNVTVVTIDVAAGETYAHASALASGITRVVKIGAGTATFGIAANGFAGTIDLQAGVADFTVRDAYGRAAINVADGAQMVVSHDSPGQQVTAVSGTVTISGSGPDGTGAIRYTSDKLGDDLFQKIVLAGDAAMGGRRYGAREIDFQGHVLTWLGTNMMALNSTWKNVGGYVHKGTADMCFQSIAFGNNTAAPAPFTLASTTGGHISFWSCGTAIPMALSVAESSRIQANWSAGAALNVWSGPIDVAAERTLTLAAGGDKSLRIAGTVGGAGAIAGGGSGVVYLDNPGNTWSGGLTIKDNANFYLPAPCVLPAWPPVEKSVSVAGGTLVAVVGKPVSKLSVTDTWSADDVQTLFDSVVVTPNDNAFVGFHTEAGVDFAYPHPVATNLNKRGAGTLRLTGGTRNRSSLRVEEGTVVLDGTATSRNDFGMFRVRTGGFVLQLAGTTTAQSVRIANGSRGQVRQMGGTFESAGGCIVAEGANVYGAHEIHGGTVVQGAWMDVATGTNAYGAIVQKGGLFQLTAGELALGKRGDAVMYVGGGTNDLFRSTSGSGAYVLTMGKDTDGSSTLTVDGSNTLFQADVVVAGIHDSPQTNVVNVTDGGTFAATRFYAESYNGASAPHSNGVFNVVNVDGGTFAPLFGWGWNHLGGAHHVRNFQKWVVFAGGMTLDTSRCMDGERTATALHEFSNDISAPTGKGFDAIVLPTSAAFKAEAYTGPARVRIVDATGWGATAFADFDPATGTLGGVKVTSRGCDYSDTPTVLVDSADGKKTYACTYKLSANVGGGLIKRGTPTARLYGTNTYTGATCVEAGELAFNAVDNVPTNSHIRVKAGATARLPGATPLKSIGGAGRIAGGAVTLTTGYVADAADLNVRASLTVDGELAFADGAVVALADPERLVEGPSRWPLVTATDAIVGTPTPDRTTLPVPFGLSFSADRKTLYLTYPNATLLIFR